MILYLPLEPYEERYTGQLLRWTTDRFDAREVDYEIILGTQLAGTAAIGTGPVLDAYGRGAWACSQTATLLARLKAAPLGPEDVILLHDLFHPGYAALPYLLDQLPAARRPRVYAQNWAQSVDVYDFTFPMRRWMRGYEQMADATLAGIFLASAVQVDLWHAAALDTAPLHVVGLPFDAREVRARLGEPLLPLDQRPYRVLYSSRWDREKQPGLFLDLAERLQASGLHFDVVTSQPRLRSNDPALLARLHALAQREVVTLHEGMRKAGYYALLNRSRVHFNCALQDFVSFTLLEASALGCPTLAPAFRSFPAELPAGQLYLPFNLDDAAAKLAALVERPPLAAAIGFPAVYHSRTLDRMLDVLTPAPVGARAEPVGV